jgi:hypothetical protein
VIVVDLTDPRAAGAVLLLCGPRCLTEHLADPCRPSGRWASKRTAVPWCTFCYRCGMSLAPRSDCRLCTKDVPCRRWLHTVHAADFARTAISRLDGPVPQALWAAADELADTITDGDLLAVLLTPRSGGPPAPNA